MAGTEWQDNDAAASALREVLAEHGAEGLSNAQVMSGMLKDLLPDSPRETNVLVQAAEAGLAQSLQQRLDQGFSPDAATAMAAKSLEEQTGLGADASLWAASTIGAAMGMAPPGGQPGGQPQAGRPDDKTVFGQVPQAAAAGGAAAAAAAPAAAGETVNAYSPPPGYQAAQPGQQAGYSAGQPTQAGYAGGQPTQAGYPAAQSGYQAGQAGYQQPGYQPPGYQGQAGYQQAGYQGAQAGQAGYPAGQQAGYQPGSTAPLGYGAGQVPPPSGQRNRTGVIIGSVAAAVVVLIGLVVWAPWKGPSVQSPAGLHEVGTATANTIVLNWSAPSSGPKPDHYKIVEDGRTLVTVNSSITTERIIDLSPNTKYQYQIIAVSGGKLSAPASLTVTTSTPLVTSGKLANAYTTNFKVTKADPKDWLFTYVGKQWTNTWTFASDNCSSGQCTVVGLAGEIKNKHFSASLTWDASAKIYAGTTTAVLGYCANNNAYPIHYKLKIGVKVTQAQESGGNWTATAWKGVILGDLPYTKAGSQFCAGHSFSTDLTGSTP
jgi:hypothetical protein